jgi:putative phosphoesterase
MIKIGLISDTHAFLDEEVLNFLAPVDEIWHAGDIGNLHVLERLEQEKPVRAVFGNIDDHKVRLACPEIQRFELEGVRVFMTHIGGYPGRYNREIYNAMRSYQPKLFISGHSHILKVMPDRKLDLLHINPGAAGKSGFHQVRTATRFVLEEGNIRDLEIWETPR